SNEYQFLSGVKKRRKELEAKKSASLKLVESQLPSLRNATPEQALERLAYFCQHAKVLLEGYLALPTREHKWAALVGKQRAIARLARLIGARGERHHEA